MLSMARDALDGLVAPLSLAHVKLDLRGGDGAAAAFSFVRCWDSDDVREALTARAERRAPDFRGR